MQVIRKIESKLQAALDPESLEVIDESHRHVGHVGARPEGETHFSIHVVSNAFAGCNRVERQRMVYTALAEELKGPVHALSVRAQAPGET